VTRSSSKSALSCSSDRTAPTENGVAKIVSDDFPVRAHEAKSRHAVKHDGSFQKLRLLRLVDLFSDYSKQLRFRFAQFELYTPLLERHWLELSGHRNQNRRMRTDLVMGNTVPPNNSGLARHAAKMPLAVRQSLEAIRATPYCFLPSTVFVVPISV
jgi:hypothetical protein